MTFVDDTRAGRNVTILVLAQAILCGIYNVTRVSRVSMTQLIPGHNANRMEKSWLQHSIGSDSIRMTLQSYEGTHFFPQQRKIHAVTMQRLVCGTGNLRNTRGLGTERPRGWALEAQGPRRLKAGKTGDQGPRGKDRDRAKKPKGTRDTRAMSRVG